MKRIFNFIVSTLPLAGFKTGARNLLSIFNELGKRVIKLVPYIFVFAGSIFMPLDADLGWHLKYGEYFYKHLAPLRDNLYSSSMRNYHWPNTSWFTDVITYSAFHLDGFIGLSILSALVVTLTFFFISKAFRLTFLKQAIFFPILLYLELPVNDVSFRGQQLSLLFLAILLFILNSYEKKFLFKEIKRVYLIPLLFFIWISADGEFLLGFGAMAVWVFGLLLINLTTEIKNGNILISFNSIVNSDVFKKLKFWIIIFIASAMVTLVNPWGFMLYTEAFKFIGNPDLKDITEYLPFRELTSDWSNLFLMGSLLLISSALFFLSGKLKKQFPNLLLAFTFFILTISIKRFAWPFYYTTPFMLSAFLGFDTQTKNKSRATGVIILGVAFIILFSVYNPLVILKNENWNIYCKEFVECSSASANFLEKTKVKGPLLTNYNWGGWLIWNYPKITPSIDGRMHLWRDANGYSAFDEYYPLEQNIKDINNSRFNTVYIWRQKPITERIFELVKEGKWKILYQDNYAIIAERTTLP